MHLEKPYLILNRSNPESYLEKSFREYVEQKGYIKNESFIQEKHWTLESGKRYISDFYFPTLKLIVEMDGLQHEQTQEEDKLKDYSIYNEFKIKTLRITHKEWTKKTRLTEIENIFNALPTKLLPHHYYIQFRSNIGLVSKIQYSNSICFSIVDLCSVNAGNIFIYPIAYSNWHFIKWYNGIARFITNCVHTI